MAMMQIGEGRPRPQSVPEAIVRSLRHEVGDLLQTVYAAVAILKERLPADYRTERRILADMRSRAESCRDLLDTVHDLVCPIMLSIEPVDVAQVVRPVVDRLAARHSQLSLHLEATPAPGIQADSRRVAQIASVLLADACSSATGTVICSVGPGAGPGEVRLVVCDDGPGVPPEKEELLFNLLTTTPHGHLGPGLALARRLVLLHGGRISAGNQDNEGFRVEVTLPSQSTLGDEAGRVPTA
jgi:signal transduction histidine kinase